MAERRRARWRRARIVVGALAFVVVALGLRGFWWEPSSLQNENYELRLPGWPAACDGLRVALMADHHVGSPFNGLDKLERIVDLTTDAGPDVALLAGDYVITGVLGGTFVPPEAIASRLARLRAPLGVYAVLGNHDWWLDAGRVGRALEAEGIVLLEDRAVQVRRDECSFWIAGVSDWTEGAHDVAAALEPVPRDAPVLLFTHHPDLFPRIPPRVSLTLAGHTHGGQVRLPLLGRPVVPSRYGQRYAAGHVVEEGRHLFVTPGLGTSILPVRLGVPPEISVLQLRQPLATAASEGNP